MRNDNKLPLSNVLNYISGAVQEVQNDNDQLLSWALAGFRKLNYENLKYVDDYVFMDFTSHQTAILPQYIKTIKEVKVLVTKSSLFTDTTATEEFENTTYYSNFLENDNFFTRLEEVAPQSLDYYCNISNAQCVYSITHTSRSNRIIQTPFKEGTLLVKFTRPIKDEEFGEYLLPEEPEVFWEYLGAFVEFKHFKERFHRGEQGAQGMFIEAQRRTAAYMTSTRRKLGQINFSFVMFKRVMYGESDFTRLYSYLLQQYHSNL